MNNDVSKSPGKTPARNICPIDLSVKIPHTIIRTLGGISIPRQLEPVIAASEKPLLYLCLFISGYAILVKAAAEAMETPVTNENIAFPKGNVVFFNENMAFPIGNAMFWYENIAFPLGHKNMISTISCFLYLKSLFLQKTVRERLSFLHTKGNAIFFR